MNRHIDNVILNHFSKFKQVLVLLGARQVGKTTLLKRLFPNALYLLMDEKPVRDIIETYNISSYKHLIKNSKQIIIDEAHLISEPGRAIKIIYDQTDDIQIIVTGSSALHIKNKTGESLAGRSILYHLYPLTFSEYLYQMEITESIDNVIIKNILSQNIETTPKLFNQNAMLENLILYGAYPYTLDTNQDRIYLENLADTAVFKDIIELNLIDNRAKARELLKLLAYQIGNLVSYNELGNKLGLHTQTVQRYVEIFEQSFILYRQFPFSQSKRNEISKTPKIYFWDLGLRNALIGNFDLLRIRPDSGALFENFIINEVQKLIAYENLNYKINYWRLKSGAEIDLVLNSHRELIGCQIKLTQGKPTIAFTNRYPKAKVHTITAQNFY